MVMSEVSTKERGVGYRFKLRVNEPVKTGGTIAIPVGTIAYGEVTSAESSGSVGKAGKLSARLVDVDVNGTIIPLTGDTTAKGKNSTGETVMAVWALGPLGLFARGNNAKIKAGELMTGFTAAEATIALPQPKPAADVPEQAAAAPAPALQ